MVASPVGKKRKAVTRDAPEADRVVLSDGQDGGDESDTGLFDTLLANLEDDGRDSDVSDAEEDLDEDDDDDEAVFSEEADEDEDDDTSSMEDGIDRLTKDVGDSEDDGKLGTTTNYTVTKDANGNERYIYNEINTAYDSDDSDAPVTKNTIGNIPLTFYDSYPHIGYDINGKRINRPAKGEALDALLDSIDVPKGWTGLTDPATGKPLELSQTELEVLKKLHMNEIPEEGFDPYPDTVPYFTDKTEIMPLNAAPEPKRRFIPSRHEAKRVMKIVRAIREGRILPYKPPQEQVEEDQDVKRYDIWANEAPRPDHPMNIPAPKLPPPGYDESYHPPPEYLPTPQEKKAWEEADDEDRDKEFLPKDHDALRKVAGYETFIKEMFERCLDLYLAPRIRRTRHTIDPESLLPKLPSPEDLRPFPTTCAVTFLGHEGRIRSLAIDSTGLWLATGGDDGTARVWELSTGRQIFSVRLSSEDPVTAVRWRPGTDASILACCCKQSTYLLSPPTSSPETEASSISILDTGFGFAPANETKDATASNATHLAWSRPESRLQAKSVIIQIPLRTVPKQLSWHRRGDYFCTVAPSSSTSSSGSAIAIHTLSKHLTQSPFRRLKGLPQAADFHPSKPYFFVATQRSIRLYDLQKQSLLKIIQPGAKWISGFDVHPLGGDNLIVGSYDKRLLWHDLDLSTRPYKTLRYHDKAIRSVKFHKGGLPLFASSSDDGTIQIYHGKVVGDLMENAVIVPLKVLKGHKVTSGLGVMEVEWHGKEAWCVSAGADGVARLWT
ncbi:Ribosome biogenesis protein erb1 [Agyrium rufum]|nr:Ribosome biogenesis protein erb1 [Agyrium rufum]